MASTDYYDDALVERMVGDALRAERQHCGPGEPYYVTLPKQVVGDLCCHVKALAAQVNRLQRRLRAAWVPEAQAMCQAAGGAPTAAPDDDPPLELDGRGGGDTAALLPAAREALEALTGLAVELYDRPEYAVYFHSENGRGRKVIERLRAAVKAVDTGDAPADDPPLELDGRGGVVMPEGLVPPGRPDGRD